MPLKLIPPSKERRTPYFTVRGTFLGVYVNRSTKTGERRQAGKILREWEDQIKRGEYRTGSPVIEKGPEPELTFAGAAIAYMNAGGERRFLTKAIEHLGREPLSALDQAQIDAGAVAAFPKGTRSLSQPQLLYAGVCRP